MDRIELRTLDKKDLLEILEITEAILSTGILKDENFKWDDTKWYLLRIEQLKKIINGKVVRENIITSSAGHLEDSVF